HTIGAPPRMGSTILAIIGSTMNIRKEPENKVIANRGTTKGNDNREARASTSATFAAVGAESMRKVSGGSRASQRLQVRYRKPLRAVARGIVQPDCSGVTKP